jgi:endonuclease/exonuclease/phosphatase family metal-dependent hydrolase
MPHTDVMSREPRTFRRWLSAAVVACLGIGAGCTAVPQGRAPTAAARVQGEEGTLRLMTFNIRYGTAPDGDDAWPLRRALAVRVIRDFDPHVLGVQEALAFQLDAIQQELTQYSRIGVGRDDGREAGEYSAILYDRRRLAPLDQGTFWLSDTPEVPGSTTWGNRITRIATWARFADRASGGSFYVFNTHFDHESQPSRERSAQLLLARIAARPSPHEPVVLTGDFNAGEDNPAFRTLLASRDGAGRLADTFRAVHPSATDVGTFHAFRGERTGAKIDAILASAEWQVPAAAIVHTNENGRFPSDHFPVTATLLLRRRD